jgi:hypothetical protein
MDWITESANVVLDPCPVCCSNPGHVSYVEGHLTFWPCGCKIMASKLKGWRVHHYDDAKLAEQHRARNANIKLIADRRKGTEVPGGGTVPVRGAGYNPEQQAYTYHYSASRVTQTIDPVPDFRTYIPSPGGG